MSTRKMNAGEALSVRAAAHARISFSTCAPEEAGLELELVFDHLGAGRILARERRPVPAGTNSIDIKTHPEATHIKCSVRAAGKSLDAVNFNVDCDRDIGPIARHFIIIGAMKAGTTTLFQLLAQHPALCRTWAEVPRVSFHKEVNYFNSLYRPGNTPLHYDWRFPFDTAKHTWTLEASPNYAKWPASDTVPGRIASLGGKVKLAYALREPVDRIESQLAHNLRRRRPARDLAHCIRTSRYAMQLDKFVRRIERDDILLLDFEQLSRDPDAVLAQICDFLAIDRFTARTVIHNEREVDFRLDRAKRAELADTLRPDVSRLISEYDFKPAKKWLRRSSLKRPGPPKLRK